jgi:hypothetical protein
MMITDRYSVPSATVKVRTTRRRARRYRGRLQHRPFIRRSAVAAPPPPALSAAEHSRRLRMVTGYLVRTMGAVPAPGIEPLTRADWLLICSVVLLPGLILVTVSMISGR